MQREGSFRLQAPFEPKGDQPRAIERAGRGPGVRRPAPDAARRHRLAARPFTMAHVIARAEPADAGHRAEQDARGAALRRVQDALSRQRRRVLRQLLRLLPARGVRPDAPTPTSRRTRRSTTRSTRCATRRPRRCSSARDVHHRRQRLVHLRPRLARGRTATMLVFLERGATRRPRRAAAQARRHPVRAQRRRLPPRHLPRARRRGRDLPGLRGRAARSASSSSATRSRRSPRSTRCAARRCAASRAVAIYPASHYVTTPSRLEARDRGHPRRAAGAPRRAARARTSCSRRSASSSARSTTSRCSSEMGFCHGIENYSRHLDGRAPGEPPCTLIDYFPKDFLLVRRREPRHGAADRRHVPRRPRAQGDAGRVRLPPAVGARQPAAQLRGVRGAASARRSTSRRRPATYELEKSGGVVVEQIIRPTGLVDPAGRGAAGARARSTICSARSASASSVGERVLVTTLTKSMAEDLTDYYQDVGVKVRYLHSDIETHRARRDHPRPAPRRLRRAGRHQPAARGPRPARGLAGRDPRRRQGRLPALGALADPDDRPRRAQRERHGDPVRRHA